MKRLVFTQCRSDAVALPYTARSSPFRREKSMAHIPQ